MKKKKLFIILLLIISCAILALTAYSVTALFAVKTGGGPIGFEGFKYFTVDSNILMAVASGLLVFYCLMAMPDGNLQIPQKILTFELVGTSAVTLTMLTSLLFLGPKDGYAEQVEGTNLFMHVITPVLAIVAFLLLEAVARVPRKALVYSMIPVVIYAALYGVLVFAGVWEDFYGFISGGLWVLSLIIMLVAQFGIALGLRVAHNKITAIRAAKEKE